jgi:HlyD family secretion protein
VKTGLSDGINIEIVSGIKKEDKIKGNLIDPKKKPEEKK